MAVKVISRASEVRGLRRTRGLTEVTLLTKRLKYQGVLHYALKYAFWALPDGGVIEIKDNGPLSADSRPYTINFNQVCQVVWTFLKDGITLLSIDRDNGNLRVRVSKPKSFSETKKWSCGIVYSGVSNEQESLRRCLDSVTSQKEFQDDSSEIVISAPLETDFSFLGELQKKVRHVVSPPVDISGRFLIAKKKNHLIEELSGDNCLVLHTRMVLDNNSLHNLDEDFDFVAPQVLCQTGQGKKRYLDFLLNGRIDPVGVGSFPFAPIYVDPDRYHEQLKYGIPFIDGGVMIFRREVLAKCPLNEHLAWFENEDVELAARLHLNGFLVDFNPDVVMVSQTDKLKHNKFNLSSRLVLVAWSKRLKQVLVNAWRFLKYQYLRLT